MLIRVFDTLRNPTDGKGRITNVERAGVEVKATKFMPHMRVQRPILTGSKLLIHSCQSNGQRELIIGDRQTDNTAVAFDTILNQKINFDRGNVEK